MSGVRDWLLLVHAPGVGPRTAAALLAQYGEPAAVIAAAGQLEAPLRGYFRAPDSAPIEAALQWARQPHCRLLTLADPDYPPALKVLSDAPPLLYLVGDPACLSEPQLAVVGSRTPTHAGQEIAHDFAAALVRAGLTITSGLALGIDAAAHRGALAGGGQTVAVLGTGADRVYPARHKELAHAIVDAGGVLVSEYPLGTPPRRGHFPRRNRLLSALALGTLVVEAARESGSLITARFAGEQGREVFAIPGSIRNPKARGCHHLIRQGAKLVETPDDILEELGPQLSPWLKVPAPAEPGEPATAPTDAADPDYQRLLASLDTTPTPVDTLVERSGLTADVVSSMLLLLELQGHVASAAGGWARTGKRTPE